MFTDVAAQIFTRYVGYDVFRRTVTESVRYERKMGFRLRNTPCIRLIDIKGMAEEWLYEESFGNTDFIAISLGDVTVHQKDDIVALTVPPTMFGTAYSVLEVTYETGFDPLPKDIEQALHEIDSLLENGQITEWNCMLPISVLDVIDKYRKKEV